MSSSHVHSFWADEQSVATPVADGFPFGQFMAMPLAEQAADGTWRAAVAISGGEPGAQRPDKCAFPQTFFSREQALKFATDQCEMQASQGMPEQ